MEELPKKTLKSWRSERGFKQIYQHYAEYVWRISFRTVNGDPELAQKITQAVFIKLLTAIKTFRFDSAFSTWLYTITYYETLAHLRKRKSLALRKAPLYEETLRDGTDIEKEREATQEVAQILEKLTPEERFLLVSKEVDGLSFDELATITGKKSGALRTALSRLKKQIVQGG